MGVNEYGFCRLYRQKTIVFRGIRAFWICVSRTVTTDRKKHESLNFSFCVLFYPCLRHCLLVAQTGHDEDMNEVSQWLNKRLFIPQPMFFRGYLSKRPFLAHERLFRFTTVLPTTKVLLLLRPPTTVLGSIYKYPCKRPFLAQFMGISANGRLPYNQSNDSMTLPNSHVPAYPCIQPITPHTPLPTILPLLTSPAPLLPCPSHPNRPGAKSALRQRRACWP